MGKINRYKSKIFTQKNASKIHSPAVEEKSQLLNKTITPKNIKSKKEKYNQKRKNLVTKCILVKKLQKEEKARLNREKTPVIGDLKPLKDALPSLDEIFKLKKQNDQLKTGILEQDHSSLSLKRKLRNKKEKFIKQVNSYHKLLQDPDFKKNPRDAIRDHIRYTHGLPD